MGSGSGERLLDGFREQRYCSCCFPRTIAMQERQLQRPQPLSAIRVQLE
jgi:hypothetical protein